MSASLSQAGPLLAPTVLASGFAAVATVPSGKVWKISGWDLVNKDGTNPENVKISLNTGDDSHLVMPLTTIGPNGSCPRYREMPIKAGTIIEAYSANGGRVVMTIHGIEITL
jgi:hypothetical protein